MRLVLKMYISPKDLLYLNLKLERLREKMSNPVSLPKAPVQPNKSTYGFTELQTLQNFTADSYRATFGIDPPPFDSAKDIKPWFDSSVATQKPSNIVTYQVPGRDIDTGKYGLLQLALTAKEASTVNIPGARLYPPYIVQPANATRTGPGRLTPQPLNPDYLSNLAQAQMILADFNAAINKDNLNLGTAGYRTEPDLGGGFGTSYPIGEIRRMWEVGVIGKIPEGDSVTRWINVGFLLKDKYSNGVGAPGHWDMSQETPKWITEYDPRTNANDTNHPTTATPVRDLLPNEEIQETLTGAVIIRTDLAPSTIVAGDPEANDNETLRLVRVIAKMLGVA